MSEKRGYARSASQMKQVTKCGEAFAISRGFRGSRPPRRPWAETIAGNAFHDMIMEWERSDRTLNPVELFKEAWGRYLDETRQEQPNLSLWMVPPRTKTANNSIDNVYKRFLEKDVPQYITRCCEAEWEIFKLPDGSPAIEIPFELDLDGVPVRGVIDRIQWWPQQQMVAVEDTKTGSPKQEDDTRQLGLYRLGAAEAYDINLTHGRYWFTKVDRGSMWTDLRRYSQKGLAEDYRKVDTIIDQDLLLPNPGEGCKLCDVKPWCSLMGWLKPGEELVL